MDNHVLTQSGLSWLLRGAKNRDPDVDFASSRGMEVMSRSKPGYGGA